MPTATPEQEAWTNGYDAAKAKMQPCLAAIAVWITNLVDHATLYRSRAAEAPSYAGNGLSAAFWNAAATDCESRASDFGEVLELLRSAV